MIAWNHRYLRYGEVWFDEPAPTSGVDILFLRQRLEPEGEAQWEEKHSLEIDLAQSLDTIFQAFKKDTRNEIRRAERDGVTYEAFSGADCLPLLTDFADFYDEFAAEKALGRLDREYLHACCVAGILDLSRARSPEGEILVWHGHLRIARRARLLYSASVSRDEAGSAFRNLVGRANRMAHWHDIQRAAAAGLIRYDFGGWYAGQKDEHLLRINRFKEEFGGAHVVQYNGLRALSEIGHACLRAKRLLQRVMRSLSR